MSSMRPTQRWGDVRCDTAGQQEEGEEGRGYIDFLILLIRNPLVSVLFCSSIPTFCSFLKMFFTIAIISRVHTGTVCTVYCIPLLHF